MTRHDQLPDSGLAILSAEFTLPPLPWWTRLRVLAGRPVKLESETDTYRFTELPREDE